MRSISHRSLQTRRVYGFIECADGRTYIASFEIDDMPYHFTGNFWPAVPRFTCMNASLEYEDLLQLNSRRLWRGTIGTERILFTLQNGPRIQGTLDWPVHPANPVAGMGFWA